MVREDSFTIGFVVDEISPIGLFGFMEEIASDRCDFILYALIDLEPGDLSVEVMVSALECG